MSSQIVSKTIDARLDRLTGIVDFAVPKSADTVLNEWSSKINNVLDLVIKTTQLISKEEMVSEIK